MSYNYSSSSRKTDARAGGARVFKSPYVIVCATQQVVSALHCLLFVGASILLFRDDAPILLCVVSCSYSSVNLTTKTKFPLRTRIDLHVSTYYLDIFS